MKPILFVGCDVRPETTGIVILIRFDPKPSRFDRVLTAAEEMAVAMNGLNQVVSELKNEITRFRSNDFCCAEADLFVDTESIRQGILDHFHQLNHITRQILNRLGPRPRRFRFIFQPCWSTRRWKSLT